MADNRTLNLNLKKYWFDKIVSGDKKEEYRLYKRYWEKRLVDRNGKLRNDILFVKIKLGYGSHAPTILMECKGIKTGYPTSDKEEYDYFNTEQGMPLCFIIELGREVHRENFFDYK